MAVRRARKTKTEITACIDACVVCHAVCTEAIAQSLERGGEQSAFPHVRLLLDCAEICQVSANFLLRGSNLHVETCAVCADVCDRCAVECESMQQGDDLMRRCAEACRRCAETCRTMAGGTTVSHAA
jgi:hypothetical protein